MVPVKDVSKSPAPARHQVHLVHRAKAAVAGNAEAALSRAQAPRDPLTVRPQPERGTVIAAASTAANPNLLVAIVMAGPDIKTVADLAGKTIAIDDRYAASGSMVRTAIVAAGAPQVQLSEGQGTALNRLNNGEVPAAVVALVTPDAADKFPEFAGFRIFQVPLSPSASKART
jgi:ABC-type phosphate/phosphonate transport system substrate-binding protein